MKPALRRLSAHLVRFVLATVVYGAMLLLLGGEVGWLAAWVYLAVIGIVLAAYVVILAVLHPDLVDERRHPPPDAKRWDKPYVFVVGTIGPLALLVVCGLDHRLAWSAPMPRIATLCGFVLVAAGGAITAYAVAVNRFFSAYVRIQHDRGHLVVDRGPYQYVRHPGYLGSILHMSGTALALGSWWALAVAVVVSLVVGLRTDLEDRTLEAELAGYASYRERVKYRLLPWVW